MAHRLFEGKEHAASYWKYRIAPSDHLIQQVLHFLEKQEGQPFELAVDVGCGSGQGTVLLANHFASVVGIDVSPAQLEVALGHATAPNVTYRQCVAEELPFSDSSVDLVTAMSAFHWFERPRFLQEAHRVLKPHGCLALLNYTIDMKLNYSGCCSQELNQVCQEFYAALRPYRSPHLGHSSVELYRQALESIPYPDKEWQECVWVNRSMPLSSYIGMVESFSSFQALLRENPQQASQLSRDITQKFLSVMKVTSPEAEVVVGVRYFYLLASKPAGE
ncbi:putative methyltransferase DDB_G0268948 [Lampris incognitus]|uniref:putative methyltransferase DDB_G0268948 n=1 Tax=Lampris incognitus TaxID=2546036 RepID=UPI0024B4A995|nr:putative methyltransferase DDB_G0268948 [Lampris incognitus]